VAGAALRRGRGMAVRSRANQPCRDGFREEMQCRKNEGA